MRGGGLGEITCCPLSPSALPLLAGEGFGAQGIEEPLGCGSFFWVGGIESEGQERPIRLRHRPPRAGTERRLGKWVALWDAGACGDGFRGGARQLRGNARQRCGNARRRCRNPRQRSGNARERCGNPRQRCGNARQRWRGARECWGFGWRRCPFLGQRCGIARRGRRSGCRHCPFLRQHRRVKCRRCGLECIDCGTLRRGRGSLRRCWRKKPLRWRSMRLGGRFYCPPRGRAWRGCTLRGQRGGTWRLRNAARLVLPARHRNHRRRHG